MSLYQIKTKIRIVIFLVLISFAWLNAQEVNPEEVYREVKVDKGGQVLNLEFYEIWDIF